MAQPKDSTISGLKKKLRSRSPFGRNSTSNSSKKAASKSSKGGKGKRGIFSTFSSKKTKTDKMEEQKQQAAPKVLRPFTWKPSLAFILDDAELTAVFKKVLEKRYEHQNLEFLLMVRELESYSQGNVSEEDLDKKIREIRKYQDEGAGVNLSSAALYEIDRGYNQFQNNSNLSFDAKKLIFHRGRLELESSCDSNGSRQSVVIRQRWTLFGSIEFQEFVNIETNWVKYQPHFKRPQTVQGGGAPTTLTRNNDESKEVEEEKEVKENEDNGYELHTPSPCPSQTVSGKMIARVSTSAKHEVSRNIKVDDGKLDIGASSSSGTPQRPSLVNITTIASVSAVLNEKPRSQSTAAPNSESNELEKIWSELSHKKDPAKK
jgi:hypothetical protein